METISQLKENLLYLRPTELKDISQLVVWLATRNEYINSLHLYKNTEEVNVDSLISNIEYCNEQIKKLLGL